MNLSRITDNEKIVLYVDILDGILHSTVLFRRSKAHPLIPHQTFIQPNLFRKACSDLISNRGILYLRIIFFLSSSLLFLESDRPFIPF